MRQSQADRIPFDQSGASMTPTLGRVVHYRLSAHDATAINTRRGDFAAHTAMNTRGTPGFNGATGHVGHIGNSASEGDICSAEVVRVNGSGASVNLQVKLDGNDTLWVTSVTEADGPGHWLWPPRVA